MNTEDFAVSARDDVSGQFAALITGAIAGALMKASGEEGPLLIDVTVPRDDEDNYLKEVWVEGRESGEKLRIRVEVVT